MLFFRYIDFFDIVNMIVQIINVYNQEYESGAAFWPDVHFRIIVALITSQVLLMGLLTTKESARATPVLIALLILTIGFHRYCTGRFESAFVKYPLQVIWNSQLPRENDQPKVVVFFSFSFFWLYRRQ